MKNFKVVLSQIKDKSSEIEKITDLETVKGFYEKFVLIFSQNRFELLNKKPLDRVFPKPGTLWVR